METIPSINIEQLGMLLLGVIFMAAANIVMNQVAASRNTKAQGQLINQLASDSVVQQREIFNRLSAMEASHHEEIRKVERQWTELRIGDAETIGRLREQLEQFKAQSQADRLTISEQSERIESMTSQLDDAQSKIADYNRLQTEVISLRAELSQLSEEVKRMNKEIEKMKQERDDALRRLREAVAENNSLRAENRKLQDQLQTRLKDGKE